MSADREPRRSDAAAAAVVDETGVVATPQPTDAEQKGDKQSSSSSQILTFLSLLFRTKPTWVDVALVLVGTVSAIAAGTPTPLIGIVLGNMMDELNSASCAVKDSGDPFAIEPRINASVKLLVAIAAAQFCLIYLYAVCWRLQSERLTHRLRDAYFRSVLAHEPAFFDDRSAGQVSSRLSADCAAVQAGTSEKVGTVIGQVSFFCTSFIVAFVRLPVLAGIMTCVLPAFLAMSWLTGGHLVKFSGRVMEASASAASIASEALNNVAVVQAFGAGPRLEAKFASHMASSRTAGIKKAFVASLQAGSIYFISYCANSLAYWQGSRMIADSQRNGGDTSVGKVFTVVFLIVDACIVLGGIAPMLPLFGGASSAYLRLKADMEQPSSIDGTDDSGHRLPHDTPGAIELQGVSFSYPSRPEQLALSDVNLYFPAGKHTALVGLSGSGKSTVAALVSRLYDPLSGTVTFDGVDIRQLNVGNLRSFISLVQQEAPLFDRSVLENIALGLVNSPAPAHEKFKPILNGPTLANLVASGGKDVLALARSQDPIVAELVELVYAAAQLADATFIERFDNGYGTQVGVGGKLVSGGQRQRIALARALIRDPRVLVLDEATAALDSASEKRIQAAIDRVAAAGGRTVISIAHRLSTIRNADNIVVMRDGRVVEQGAYADLVASGGAFAAMVNLQGIGSGDDRDSVLSAGSTCIDAKGAEGVVSVREKDQAVKSERSSEQADKTPIPAGSNDEKTEAPADKDPEKPASEVVRGVGWLVRPSIWWLIMGIIGAVVVGCAFSASGLLVGNTLALLNPCVTTPEGVLRFGQLFGGLIFMLAFVELVANIGSWLGFGVVSENILYKTKVLSLRALMSQTVEWHQSEGRTPASLLSIITKDGAALQGFSGSIVGTLLSILVNFLFAIILSHVLAWKLALVCLAVVPILLTAGIMQFRAFARFDEKHEKAYASAIGITVEAVNSMKTVASLSLEKELIGTYRRTLKGPRRDMLKASLHTNVWLSVASSTGFFVNGLVYWWGSQLIMRGENTQSQFFTVNIALLVSANLWGHTFALAPEISRARSSASRILGLIDLTPDRDLSLPDKGRAGEKEKQKDVEASAEPKPPPPATLLSSDGENRGVAITFRDVSFAYPTRPNVPILNGASFTVAPGQFVGLVGPSGAGKSTILALMQRLYAPSAGSIAVDGVDVSSAAGRAAFPRDEVAVVPQDSALFDGTVRFNVGLGARPGREATDAEIEEACRLANLHDTIVGTLPRGYDTECGPNGSRLSGGQRQRLAIARALVRRPRLLLLDESTSALDAESEAALQEGLERVARGITVVAITHRLHTVQKANFILVVEGGRVVERGTHRELMERSESYRVNAMQQMLQ
ncbi:hypothetical protein MCOR07_004544 [Pyricularia oryzae]|uniref:Leptomycin B resistance protein pmd1 n=3 Tax=Pyricularia TaxID=48558 RepID=A0ABQ8NR17_PYRGI|nr:hypothetical protein MCOR01_010723 [Pyricularia oryzae]KAI6300276.1 hypothetical protein MCOR33_003957 [Pyricularia grisea]KAI6259364.1 hypothetical protein MCOR19_004285 [Pyricularia oryzae]KAI6272092.1 hypothetical protein MCOR26_007500 [Pyricularia oryzae]KAI6318387.1 hypothetical protein MCOR29_005969 [Pyricularia oryzae]